MSQVGMWNGVNAGAAPIAGSDRKNLNANYAREAQRNNMLAAFASSAAPGLG